MKRSTTYTPVLVAAVLALVLWGCDSSQMVGPDASVRGPGNGHGPPSGGLTTVDGFEAGDLLAGQDEKVGTVSVTEEPDGEITVTYEITEPCWFITEWHLDVKAGAEEVPQAGNGNPIPGQFTYSGEGVTTTTVTVTDIPNPGGDFVVAAHAVVESDEDAEYVYGISNDEGVIYAVDLANKTSVAIFDTDLDAGNENWPNGLAYDPTTERLYYVDEDGKLYFIDPSDPGAGETHAGTVGALNAGATFYEGDYYYVPHDGDDDLHRVSFDVNGDIANEEIVASDFTGRADASFQFGDLAARDDVIFFHADDVGSSPGGIEFSQFDMSGSSPVYTQIETGYAAKLQLAFGSDGTLFGHQTFADANPSTTIDGNFWEVQLDGTLVSPKIGPVDGLVLNDLSSSGIRCEDRSETAWAFGEAFPGGNWATYFVESFE